MSSSFASQAFLFELVLNWLLGQEALLVGVANEHCIVHAHYSGVGDNRGNPRIAAIAGCRVRL
ncbi:MAG: hypothetical protein ACE5JI_13915 [Acidobacteriota bacterium]